MKRNGLAPAMRPSSYSLGIAPSAPMPALPKAWMRISVYEKSVEAKEATALGHHAVGEQPDAFFARAVGEGQTLYMNVMDTTYVLSAEQRHRRVWGGILKAAGLARSVRVERDGERVPFYDIKRFRDGDARYVGIIRSPRFGAHLPERADVRFEKGRAEVVLPLAVNAPEGEWRIRAREVISGKEAEAKLEVRQARGGQAAGKVVGKRAVVRQTRFKGPAWACGGAFGPALAGPSPSAAALAPALGGDDEKVGGRAAPKRTRRCGPAEERLGVAEASIRAVRDRGPWRVVSDSKSQSTGPIFRGGINNMPGGAPGPR